VNKIALALAALTTFAPAAAAEVDYVSLGGVGGQLFSVSSYRDGAVVVAFQTEVDAGYMEESHIGEAEDERPRIELTQIRADGTLQRFTLPQVESMGDELRFRKVGVGRVVMHDCVSVDDTHAGFIECALIETEGAALEATVASEVQLLDITDAVALLGDAEGGRLRFDGAGFGFARDGAAAIVIDITDAGFIGDDTLVPLRFGDRALRVMVGMGQKDAYVGDEAQS